MLKQQYGKFGSKAFAKCSILLYLREKDSKEEYNNQIEQSKIWIVNSQPIWGVGRETPEAYTALYNNGSLILLEFEEKIGTTEFYKFFKMLLEKKYRILSIF